MFKEKCKICGVTVGLNRIKIREGYICPSCYKKAGYGPDSKMPIRTAEDVKIDIDSNTSS